MPAILILVNFFFFLFFVVGHFAKARERTRFWLFCTTGWFGRSLDIRWMAWPTRLNTHPHSRRWLIIGEKQTLIYTIDDRSMIDDQPTNPCTSIIFILPISFLFFLFLLTHIYLVLHIFTFPIGNLGFGAGGTLWYRKKMGQTHSYYAFDHRSLLSTRSLLCYARMVMQIDEAHLWAKIS